MCFRLRYLKTREKAREATKPLIAKKDITVFKVLSKSNSSPYTYFRYEKGMNHYQDGKAFSTRVRKGILGEWQVIIDKGLHSCRTYSRAKRITGLFSDKMKIVRMVIPKGAKYFCNKEEYVSDQLIWY